MPVSFHLFVSLLKSRLGDVSHLILVPSGDQANMPQILNTKVYVSVKELLSYQCMNRITPMTPRKAVAGHYLPTAKRQKK